MRIDMSIREEARENLYLAHRHVWIAYSSRQVHEEYRLAIIMAEWALQSAG
jgi:hypothetical protein